jgi:hypothetical protein
MAKNIKVKIDVDSNSVQIAGEETLSLVQKVKTLEAALKKVPEGTKEWSTLSAAYKTASADLDKLNVKSKELFNTLSTPQDVEIDIDVNTEEADGKFVKLQTRIRQTKIALQQAAEAGDTQTFNILKEELDQLQDQFEKTTTQSKKFEDALATVPGPAGMVGKAIKGIDDAFKFLIANPIVAAIAAIGAVLFGMYKALTQTKEGMAVLNKITDAFGNILQQVIKVVSAVAIPIFEGFAKVIAFVSAAVADATGNYKEYQEELANDEAARIAEANAEKIKRILDEQGYKYDEFTKKKIAADGAYNTKLKEINDSNDSDEEKRQRKRDAILTRNKAILDADAERQKNKDAADKTARDKGIAAAEKAFNDKVARMSAEDKLDEAKLEKLKQEALAIATTEEEKLAIEELYAKKKYELVNKNLLELQALYGKDSKEYMDYQTQLISLDASRTKEASDEKEKRKKLIEDEIKENKDSFTARLTAAEVYYKDEKFLLDRQLATKEITETAYKGRLLQLDTDFNAERLREAELFLSSGESILQREFEKGLLTQDEYNKKLLELQKNNQLTVQALKDEANTKELDMLKFISDKNQEYADQQKQINAEIAQSYIDLANNIGATFNNVAQLLEKGSVAAKAFGILSVIANAASGIGTAIIKNQEAQAAYNKTIADGIAGMASAGILMSNPITALLGAFQFAAAKTAVGAATAGKVTSKVNTGIQIGAITAASAAQIAAITSAKSVGSSSAGGSGSTGSTPTPAMTAPQQAQVPNIGASVVSSEGRIGQIVTGAATEQGMRPIQTYVVGSQVSTQQQLDRRVALAAKMPG